MRTLGLLGGMSWESTLCYYKMLNEGVRAKLGGLHSAPLLVCSFDFAPVATRQAAGDWDALGRELGSAGRRLVAAGAEAFLICTNTMHRVHAEVEAQSGRPAIHIADATGEALRRAGCRRPALLGTRFTMEGDFYRGRLAERHGIEAVVPDAAGRALVHGVIYDELCRGIIRTRSKEAYLDSHRAPARGGRGRGDPRLHGDHAAARSVGHHPARVRHDCYPRRGGCRVHRRDCVCLGG